jgi:tetratricopeptide (TPR) repeat protein
VLFLGLSPGAGTGSGPAQAQAQTRPEPTAEDKMQAKVYFERGEALKQSGRARADAGDMDGARAAFSEAAGLYLRAFRLFPHSAFVFNAAQMHRLSGETGPAIAAYERYLEIDPEGAKAGEARTYITQLRRSQAAAARASQNEAGADAGDEEAGDEGGEGAGDEGGEEGEEAGDEDGEDGEDGEEVDEDAGDEGAGDDAQAAGDAGAGAASQEFDDFDAADEPARTGRPLRIAGLATAAAGAISFGIGIKYGLDAQSIADDLSQPRSMWGFEERELYEDGERAERTALIFMGIGGAALVTGGVLYLIGHNRDSTEVDAKPLAVSASASPDGVSMLLWGRF